LSMTFKMNRSLFETKDIAMEISSVLADFKAKIDKEIEKSEDFRGNRKLLQNQIVKTNVPPGFNLCVSVFKNHPKTVIAVEIVIDPDDLSCALISPELNDYIVENTDILIDSELTKIRELFPSLRIFEN